MIEGSAKVSNDLNVHSRSCSWCYRDHCKHSFQKMWCSGDPIQRLAFLKGGMTPYSTLGGEFLASFRIEGSAKVANDLNVHSRSCSWCYRDHCKHSFQKMWSSCDPTQRLASLQGKMNSYSASSAEFFASLRITSSAKVSNDSSDHSREAWLVDEVITPFNNISVIELGSQADHEFAGAYILKLDDRDLVHSVYWHDQRVWTGAYYDEFTLLPPLLPPGPIAVLGLGAGTVARILLHVWPSRQLEGWELDPEVVRVGRAYFGMANLEDLDLGQHESRRQGRAQHGRKRTISRPGLVVHVGDALREDVRAEGRFAGLIVDLYSQGHICEGLKDSSVWAMLRRRLRPGGRVMVNCGGPPIDEGQEEEDSKVVLERKEWLIGVEATVTALSTAFDGQVNIKQLQDEGRNVMLLSGDLPPLEDWSVKAPTRLRNGTKDWQQQRGRLRLL